MMAETSVVTARPDVDIAEAIERLITRYPPMVNDRHHVRYTVENGKVTISGYTKTGITARYLVENVRQVEGVTEVDASGLHDDETIRLEMGRAVPVGIFANVEYGLAILTGRLPADLTEQALIEQVQQVSGVRTVRTRLMA